MQNSSKTVKSIIIMILFSIGSKLLGFIREMLIAAKFGSGIETDTFFIALAATGLFTSMFTQSLNTTLIPILSDIERNKGTEGKKEYINNLLNIVILISVLLVLFGWSFSPIIIRLLAHGFEGKQFDLAVNMMRIGMPVIIFSGIVGIYRGYLQSESMFIESSVSEFPFNLTYIMFLIFLSSLLGIKGLMITSVLAVFSQILIQFPSIKKLKYSYEFRLNFKDPNIKRILYLVLPVLVSVAVNDLNKIVDRSLASTLVEGSISALNYSARLNSIVLAVFITAIATVLFPLLSKAAGYKTYDAFKRLVGNGVNIVLIITIPTTIGIIILARPMVELIFERGAFDLTATRMTSQALIFYSLGLVGMALRTFMERAYYSLQDTKTPMLNGFVAVGLNIILNFTLIGPMKYTGLALATSISTTLTTVYLFYGLRKKVGPLGFSNIFRCGFKSLLSSFIMAIIVYFSYYSFVERFSDSKTIEFIILSLSIALGAIVYLITLYLFQVEEMVWFFSLFKKKFGGKSA
ncbi:murein biosynthesis integral membrane protein MurJ [Sporosalibacterium faouarense]|uniref:murein biosynthesis integral membrane protein MurJ n=1 Tax=Sporosalibacterium faouarense TaxID=516123 RepID=UPI001FAF77F9|nr:murein biosynthesis integral membrane protein MurJ [Sporosalibacterium faouarense]